MNNDTKYTLQEIKDLRLCSTGMPDSYYNKLKTLKSLKNNKKEFDKFRSIFLKENLWKIGDQIKIQFIGIPYENVSYNDIQTLIKIYKDDRKTHDPLQKSFEDEYVLIVNSSDNEALKIANIRKKMKEYVKRVIIERFQPICNLNFIIDDTETIPKSKYQIRISFVKKYGSSSLVGTDSKKYTDDISNYSTNTKVKGTLNIGWFNIFTVIHEFGHAIGLKHEHQTLCGFKPKWNKELLYTYYLITDGWPKYRVDSNIINLPDINNVLLSNYDPKSIMLYEYSSKLTLNGIGTNENYKLSPNDALYICKIYHPNKTYSDLVQWYNSIYPDNWIVMPGTNITLKLTNTYTIWDGLKLLFLIIILPTILYCIYRVYKYCKLKNIKSVIE